MRIDQSIVYWLGNSLYLNVTNRCSNRCYFCFRHYWDGIAGFKLKLTEEPDVKQIIKELSESISRRRWREVVFCGFGEPMMRLDCVIEVAKWIKKHFYMKVRVNTNGHGFLINPGRNVVEELKEAGVDGVSVSLNGHDEKTYNEVCRPIFKDAYKSALEFIRRARDSHLDVEVTVVRVPEIDISRIRNLTSKLKVGFRVRDYIPCFY